MCSCFPPRLRLHDSKLAHMKAVLTLEKIAEFPSEILGKKYSRLRLPNGQVAGSVRTTLSQGNRRRDHLVRVRSTCRKRAQGAEEVVPVNVYDAVHHYVVVYSEQKPMAFAYIECIKASADRRGAFGLAEKRRWTDCFSALGGAMRYVNVLAIDAVVGTLYVGSRHVVLYCRETFSIEE